jgi:hypothetical protein
MSQVHKPRERERPGLAVPKRGVELRDDHRSTDKGWS